MAESIEEPKEDLEFRDAHTFSKKEIERKIDEEISTTVKKVVTQKAAKIHDKYTHEMDILQVEERMFGMVDNEHKERAFQEYLKDKKDARKKHIILVSIKLFAVATILLLGGTQAAIEFGAKLFGLG